MNLTLHAFSIEVLPEALHPTHQWGPDSDHSQLCYLPKTRNYHSERNRKPRPVPSLNCLVMAESTRGKNRITGWICWAPLRWELRCREGRRTGAEDIQTGSTGAWARFS